MPFLLQKSFIDSLNYFHKIVSFAREVLDLRKKNVDIPEKKITPSFTENSPQIHFLIVCSYCSFSVMIGKFVQSGKNFG